MHKEELLVVSPYPQPDMELLSQKYDLQVLSEAKDSTQLLAQLGPRIRVLATNGESGANATLIDALPNLEIIVSYGVGVDAIDLAHAARRGIRVTNTPDVLTGDVADMGMALMLAAARNVAQCDALMRAGQWGHEHIPLTTRVFGKRLGILGLGRVGRAVAKRAEAFDMQVSYHDRMQFDDVSYNYFPSMVALAAEVDFLMVCAAADQMPRGALGKEVLDALGAKGILINIARGSIIDEPALLESLIQRHIGGAALDVFWNEPAIDKRFLDLPNVLLQPHRASATVETRSAMARLVRDNLDAFFSNSPLPTEFTMHLAKA